MPLSFVLRKRAGSFFASFFSDCASGNPPTRRMPTCTSATPDGRSSADTSILRLSAPCRSMTTGDGADLSMRKRISACCDSLPALSTA